MGPGQFVENLNPSANLGLDFQNHGITQYPQSPIGVGLVVPLRWVVAQPWLEFHPGTTATIVEGRQQGLNE